MPTISLEQYDRLIATIYTAGLDSRCWRKVISVLGDMLDGVFIGIQGHDIQSNNNILAVSTHFDQDYLKTYNSYYAQVNPWIDGMATIETGKAIDSQAFLPREKLIKSEFYNDWLRPQDDLSYGVGLVLFREKNRMLALTANFRESTADQYNADIIELLSRISSHMQRAFSIQRSIEGQSLIIKSFHRTFDDIGNSVFLINARGQVLHHNRAAETLLKTNGLFFLDPRQVLRAFDPLADKTMHEGLHAITFKNCAGLHDAFAVRSKNELEPHLATLVPFHPDHEATGMFAGFFGGNLPAAMLTVVDPTRNRDPAKQALSALYKLTPAEISLAEALFQGQSLKTHAEMRDVSIHTVRNQMKSIFSKTDTKKQSELVALIGRLSSI